MEPAASTVMLPEVPEPVAEASGAGLGSELSLPDDMPEDLIDLLIGRDIIKLTDFPGMARSAVLINRRALRSNMLALTNLVSDEESIF